MPTKSTHTATDDACALSSARPMRVGILVVLLIACANLYHYYVVAFPPAIETTTTIPTFSLRTAHNHTTARHNAAKPPVSFAPVKCTTMDDSHRDKKFLNPSICYTRSQIVATIRDMVLTLTSILEQHNVTYFLESGTLLGAYRHQGVIPHDSDADLAIDQHGYEYLRDHTLDEMPSQYFLEVWNSTYHPNDRDDKLPVRLIHKESALYVDVFVFLEWEHGTQVGPLTSWCYFNCVHCDRVAGQGKRLRLPYDWVYPLVDCEFEGNKSMKCPRETKKYLEFMFGRGFMVPQEYHH